MADFHEGEQRIQALADTVVPARRNAGVLSDRIAPGAAPWLPLQRILAVASLAPDGQPCASVLEGEPGLASAPDPHSVLLDRRRIAVDPADPLWAHLAPGAAVGLLAIELATRRRYRINGHVAAVDDEHVTVRVREAFANCPQYVVRRTPSDATPAPAPIAAGERLDDRALDRIARADTLFVASRHPERGADVSHRGGPPGFADADPSGLLVPDYPGNGMFQTLGNLDVDPRAGVVIPDFSDGRMLQLVGRVEILHGRPDPEGRTRGTGRSWRLRVERWQLVGVGALRWG
jgi:uncharacterized protein